MHGLGQGTVGIIQDIGLTVWKWGGLGSRVHSLRSRVYIPTWTVSTLSLVMGSLTTPGFPLSQNCLDMTRLDKG